MTPEREAALEACVEALKELVMLKRVNESLGAGVLNLTKRYRIDAENSTWRRATEAAERLEGLE